MTFENIEIKVKPISGKGKGFLRQYRQILATRRALTEFEKATPEGVDAAFALLADHITQPADHKTKMQILENVDEAELVKLFDLIMGSKVVPPASGEA